LINENKLAVYLDSLGLGAYRYYPVVGSTNDLALDWAKQGAPDWSLVLADAQTAGRGRYSRRWVTRPGGALAMSLVLRPLSRERGVFPRFTALAALGLLSALSELGLCGEIKWPNAILLQKKKVGGVLVEADWQADEIQALVIGLGVNVALAGVPASEDLRYPAISVEDAAGKPVDRWALLADTLRAMKRFRSFLVEDAFMAEWQAHLAFLGDWVMFRLAGGQVQRMKILAVSPEGRLVLECQDGQRVAAVSGEILMGYN